MFGGVARFVDAAWRDRLASRQAACQPGPEPARDRRPRHPDVRWKHVRGLGRRSSRLSDSFTGIGLRLEGQRTRRDGHPEPEAAGPASVDRLHQRRSSTSAGRSWSYGRWSPAAIASTTSTRGVPRMSRTLLSKRLSQLVDAGLVERLEGNEGPVYRLTEAGQELRDRWLLMAPQEVDVCDDDARPGTSPRPATRLVPAQLLRLRATLRREAGGHAWMDQAEAAAPRRTASRMCSHMADRNCRAVRST